MSETMTDNSSFPFIISNGPRVPKDPAVRTLIRKQAMRDVGMARKKKGNYGRVNMRQFPAYAHDRELTTVPIRSPAVDLGDGEDNHHGSHASSITATTSSSDTISQDDYDDLVQRDETSVVTFRTLLTEKALLCSSLSVPTLSTNPDYERARSEFGLDLTDLSILTNFNVGKSTIAILSADPSRLASLLGQPQRSFLEFVPSRYGSSECLTAATNVLLAKARLVLAPRAEQHFANCNRLYGKALRSLQDALSNEAQAMDADVLCATQLLSLHELLDPAKDTAWSHHVNGSGRLVRHRSASRFKSEYEKALFVAHVGAVVSESLVNNTHCYLERPEWIRLFSSLAEESRFLTDRSSLAIQVRVAMCSLPGLWHDIGEAVNGSDFEREADSSSLQARCRKAHEHLLDWLEEYKEHCVRLSFAQPPPAELSLRRELFGSTLECLVIVKRLLATICEVDRRTLEVETQALAHLILDLQKQPSPKHSWLFSGHEVGVAYTVLLTKDQWEEQVASKSPEERRMASRRRYNTWSNTLRMTG